MTIYDAIALAKQLERYDSNKSTEQHSEIADWLEELLYMRHLCDKLPLHTRTMMGLANHSNPSYTPYEKDASVKAINPDSTFIYFWCICEKCGWQGSSEFVAGGDSMGQTGDYNDIFCPKCYTVFD